MRHAQYHHHQLQPQDAVLPNHMYSVSGRAHAYPHLHVPHSPHTRSLLTHLAQGVQTGHHQGVLRGGGGRGVDGKQQALHRVCVGVDMRISAWPYAPADASGA